MAQGSSTNRFRIIQGGNVASVVNGVTDSLGSGNPALVTMAQEAIYNPTSTNMNRARTVANSTDSDGTGVQAVGLLAQFDDTSPSTVTENQFANLRMTSRRALHNSLYTPNGDSAMDETNDAVRTTLVTATPAGTNNIGDMDIETFENSADVTMQNAATATGNGTVLTTTGYGTAVVQVTGTFVGTITFEGSVDGTNYHAISATQMGTTTIATTATTTGIYRTSVSGLTNIRARVSAYTSGSITAVGRCTNATYGSKIVALGPGTNIIGSLAANQSVNIGQLGGIATALGNGTTSTGTLRVTLSSDSTGQVIARGAAAHGSAVSGNPLLNGAEGRTTDQTAVTSGQTTRVIATSTGKQVVMPYALPELTLSGTASATGTSNTAIIAAQGAGVRIYVTTLVISNSSTTDTEVEIKSATTTLMTIPAPQKSGATINLPVPLRLTANEALNFASLASVMTMKVSAVGYSGV
jgi:hypothetical protein